MRRVVAAEDEAVRPIVAVRVNNSNNGRSEIVYALLDSGSDVDVISEGLVERLQIIPKWSELTLVTLDSRENMKRAFVGVSVESIDKEYVADVRNALVGNLLTSETDLPPAKRDVSKYSHLSDIVFEDHDAKVEMIVGAAHVDAWVFPSPEHCRKGTQDQPRGLFTKFGWTMVGIAGKRRSNSIACHQISIDDASLRNNLERIFYQDFASCSEEETGMSVDQKSATQQLIDTTKFDKDIGKYVAGIPWRKSREEAKEAMNSVDSEAMCLKRLNNTRAKLQRDPELKERAFTQMDKFEEEGYAINIEKQPGEEEEKGIWYLPIHIVEEMRNGKLKTRICHDARASTGGICLNDLILTGLNLICPIQEVMMFWRTFPVGVTGDLVAFFHNVRVLAKDVHAYRYYWFNSREAMEPQLKLFLSHVFGSGASSFVTSFVMQLHAKEMEGKYPENVIDAIRSQFYVDDYTGGERDVPAAKKLVKGLKEAMGEGGFDLAKWKSNKPEVFEEEGQEGGEEKQLGGSDVEELTKVLGMTWNSTRDVFTFAFDEEKFNKEVKTPRHLVSVQAAMYDPLGLVSPNQFLGRKMLQQATAGQAGWDSILSEEVKVKFAGWAKNVKLLTNYSVPRYWGTDVTVDVTSDDLHVFGDASAEGYGAVAYRRVVGTDGSVFVTILYSRSLVIPLDSARASHHNQIPRLEMAAAVKISEIRQFCERAVRRKFTRVFLWSDSEAVLKMIFDSTKKYLAFYSNRLSKIHATSKNSEWNKVDGKDNPADYCSRGIQASEAGKWEKFHKGPEFLWKDESYWPKLPFSRTPMPSPISLLFAIASPPIIPGRRLYAWEIAAACSNWSTKIRRLALIKNFIKLWKIRACDTGPITRNTSRTVKAAIEAVQPTHADYVEAENLLIREIQEKNFKSEVENLKANGIDEPLGRKEMKLSNSKIAPHNPFIDADGIIRVGSRLAHAPIQEETKFPAILPRDDTNVKDLIRRVHLQEFHAGPKHVLAQLRRRFWILQGLQEVKKVTSRCTRCQRFFKKPVEQQMGPLPANRVTPTAPFQSAGVDMAGPFHVKMNGRASHKVYVIVFTCFSTRAIHLEVVHAMDASSFIDALRRFVARRPGVVELTSDNGTNFVAADRILKKEMKAWREASAGELQRQGLEWNWIPVAAPHRGGVWERTVGLFKKHLTAVTRGDTIHIKTFETIIIEIESILNRRPLTAISADSRDVEALTPAHILYPATYAHSSATIIPDNVASPADVLRTTWKRAESRINAFWNSWTRDYLVLLHDRKKWTKVKRDLKVDDIVIIVDTTASRNEWRLGRVVEADVTDGTVKKVRVKRADKKIVTRDRTKLVLLELDE